MPAEVYFQSGITMQFEALAFLCVGNVAFNFLPLLYNLNITNIYEVW